MIRCMLLATAFFSPGPLLSQEIPSEIRESILDRCRTQMSAFGAATVKFCVDEDVAAYQALSSYPDGVESILDRCRNQVLSVGGWTTVKFCADQDIAAERALRGE